MFIDASPNYTDTETYHTIKNPIAFHCYVHKQRNVVSSYTDSTHARIIDSKFQVSSIQEKLKLDPAPKKLKQAIFAISSKAIAKSLSNK